MKNKMRRTMMFVNTQRPSMILDAGVFGADSLIFDLEDAIAESEKDAARYALYYALRDYDFGDVEKIVRINGLDTLHYKEDIFVAVKSGADGIRIPKCQCREDVIKVESIIEAAEKKFKVPIGKTSLMVAIESPRGIVNISEILGASSRLFGVALGAGDFLSELGTQRSDSGLELLYARSHLLMHARANGLQCFDTAYLDLENMDGFRAEVSLIHQLGFDGKSVISPTQISIVNEIFCPSELEYKKAIKLLNAFEEHNKKGIGVFLLDGKMVDIALIDGARRIVRRYNARVL